MHFTLIILCYNATASLTQPDPVVISHSQTAVFPFILGRGKIGSDTLTIQFLFRLPPSLGWVMTTTP